MIKKGNIIDKKLSKKEISNKSLKQKPKTKVSRKTTKKTKTVKSGGKITKGNSKDSVGEKSSLNEDENTSSLENKSYRNKLTPKQEIFCHEYLKDLNATQSCIRAGYSEKTADKIGPELLGKTSIQEKVQELKNNRIERAEIDGDYVVKEIKYQYELCKKHQIYTDKNGNIKIDSSGTTKNLELLGKHYGVFIEKQEIQHTGLGDMLIELKKKNKLINE